jgi:cellulose synthase/poly-beta-1,6-N-acetylglucosamine synthase-like glycosyltransferase
MGIQTLILYFVLFVSLFFEIFLLITYFEVKDELKFEEEHLKKKLSSFPSVTIIVPCFNEEATVKATVESILALDYPKDRLDLILVDDGSTDSTFKMLKSYEDSSRIRVFKKENGGKHTALNFALEHVRTELVGCLDADSFVAADALQRIVPYFEDKTIMAVTPSIKVHEPKTILQKVQKIEYVWGIFLRRMLASIEALYVTPGPFSIFRITVFKELGGYRHAHQTEDMEMALRMQKNRYRIANSVGAHVFTVAPPKLSPLYKQRRRWTYGYLKNAFDYRDMYFNKKYGNIGLFILPIGTLSIFSTLYAAGNFVVATVKRLIKYVQIHNATGWGMHFSYHFSFDWFFLNTGVIAIITALTIILSISLLFVGLNLAKDKVRPSLDMLYYLTIYIFIVPLWLAGAVYNSVFSRRISWR